MKNFGKFFVLCFLFSIITTIFVSCGPNLDASIYRDPNSEIITDNTQNKTTIDQQDEQPDPINTDVTPNDEPELPDNKEPETNDEEPNGNEPTETKLECEHDFEDFIAEKPTCTKPGYSIRKCKACGFPDENNKTTIPATGHHESTKHPHQCEDCDELLIDSPLQDLAHSYWYLNEKVTIYFEKCTPIVDGYHGNYCTFYGSLSDDGYFIKNTTPNKIKNIYEGDYNLTSFTDPDTGITQYFIYLYCNNAETYYLEYKVTIDENTEKPSYTLFCTNKYLFYKDYKNCTLIFAGYEL